LPRYVPPAALRAGEASGINDAQLALTIVLIGIAQMLSESGDKDQSSGPTA
jgi:hypothetical protein